MSPFVAFTPDARTLVTAGRAMSIETWDVNTGEKRATFQTDWDAMRLVPAWPTISRIPLLRISPDGKTLASAGGKGHPDAVVVRLWDLATGRQRGGADLKFQVQCLAFSPDSRILAVGGLHWAEPLRLLDVETGKQLAGLKGHDALVIAVFFLPDGKTLVSAGNDEAIRWWDVPPR
jgi:WD40 repeat protein